MLIFIEEAFVLPEDGMVILQNKPQEIQKERVAYGPFHLKLRNGGTKHRIQAKSSVTFKVCSKSATSNCISVVKLCKKLPPTTSVSSIV